MQDPTKPDQDGNTTELDLSEIQSDADVKPYETIELPKGAVAHIYDKLQSLDNRVSELEVENAELQRQNYTLRQAVEEVNNTQETTITEMEEQIEEFEQQIQILKSQAGYLADHSIEVEETIESLQNAISTQRDEINERLAKLESGTTDETGDPVEVGGNCELESLRYLDEETIESEFSVDTRRAVIVWDNFEEWSSRTPGGRTLKSGELKKLLSSNEGTTLAWTQVSRVMACFAEKTPEMYEVIDNNRTGKAIVKRV